MVLIDVTAAKLLSGNGSGVTRTPEETILKAYDTMTGVEKSLRSPRSEQALKLQA